MTAYPCPLCSAPMVASVQPSEHPAIPQRVVLTCSVCRLTLQDADYATFVVTPAVRASYARAEARAG